MLPADPLSEASIRAHCPHCDPGSQAYEHNLEETENFRVVCDAHPLCESHLLIIPKMHISCIGEYSKSLFKEFSDLYKRTSALVEKNYGSVATFEHGIWGQTVFHSHIHILPFDGRAENIIPEGRGKMHPINDLSELKGEFEREGGYLFFSIGSTMWVVDKSLATPGSFRDRFAKALHHPERGPWKEMHMNQKLMEEAGQEIVRTEKLWKRNR